MFKVGDLIRGNNHRYTYTNSDMLMGEVIRLSRSDSVMDIRILQHIDATNVNCVYEAENSMEQFCLLNKKLPTKNICIYKVSYSEPYFSSHIGYFKNLDSIIRNFGSSIDNACERNRISKRTFLKSSVKNINKYVNGIKIERLVNKK